MRALTDGRGVDLVVDSVGGRILTGSDRKSNASPYRRRCITVGSAGRDPQPFDVSVLGMNNQSMTGVFLGAEIVTDRAQQMITRLIDDVATGRLQVLVDRTYPFLGSRAAAHVQASREPVRLSAAVLIPLP